MFGAMVMEVLVVMGMGMIMGVRVIMGMGVSHTIVGMFMGMGVGMFMVMGMTAHMVVMQMHGKFSFAFFLYYSPNRPLCQNIYFSRIIPLRGLREQGKARIMKRQGGKDRRPIRALQACNRLHTIGISRFDIAENE